MDKELKQYAFASISKCHLLSRRIEQIILIYVDNSYVTQQASKWVVEGASKRMG